ncbi:MAG: Jag N-terminal domain-containing protein [Sulfurimonas sp.]|nr:Jag N-terminal domain-containing protein [Sulfurimonas sp.]
MIKIVSVSLEEAYKDAASKLECSVTELTIEVVQSPSSGFLGLFKKSAIIVAAKKLNTLDKAVKQKPKEEKKPIEQRQAPKAQVKKETKQEVDSNTFGESTQSTKVNKQKSKYDKKKSEHNILNDMIIPETFVSTQDDEDYDMADINFTADYDEDDSSQKLVQGTARVSEIAQTVEKELNTLFHLTCFEINKIDVSAYDENTLLVEFKGEDAALLIGKEGYRYKALSYMIFNWINTKYKLQLRLEIAEFLKNQEESVGRYLVGVCENVDRDGRAQTKILDGVLVQIALKELRDKYPDKYVAIRSTRDGLKFIIINDYHN